MCIAKPERWEKGVADAHHPVLQCALPNENVTRMVEFMLSVLACGYDPARKNAVLFFGGAIHFRAVLTIFDHSNGLARILDCLQTVLMLLHGQQDLKTEKQVRLVSVGACLPMFAGSTWRRPPRCSWRRPGARTVVSMCSAVAAAWAAGSQCSGTDFPSVLDAWLNADLPTFAYLCSSPQSKIALLQQCQEASPHPCMLTAGCLSCHSRPEAVLQGPPGASCCKRQAAPPQPQPGQTGRLTPVPQRHPSFFPASSTIQSCAMRIRSLTGLHELPAHIVQAYPLTVVCLVPIEDRIWRARACHQPANLL